MSPARCTGGDHPRRREHLRLVRRLLVAPALLWVAGGGVAWSAELSAEQRVETLNEALRAFDRGSGLRSSDPHAAGRAFSESAEKFQLLVDTGLRNGALFYNLGNACLRAGELGRAILNYRRAERLIPGDGQLEANLAFARSLRQDQIPVSGSSAFLRTLFAWHFKVPLRTRYALGLGAYVMFWALLVARIYWPGLRWGYAALPCLVVWLTLGVSLASEVTVQSKDREGVLVVREAIVRKGNGDGFEPQFAQPLHEGVEFSVLERRRDWLHVELPDGKAGWIRAAQAELI